MPSTAERLAIADVMARHADGLRRLARRDERYVPVSAELKEAIRVAKLTPSETYTTDGTDGEYVTTYVKAPKPTRRQLQAQIDDLRAEIKRLELVLSQHACDCTRHATPATQCLPYTVTISSDEVLSPRKFGDAKSPTCDRCAVPCSDDATTAALPGGRTVRLCDACAESVIALLSAHAGDKAAEIIGIEADRAGEVLTQRQAVHAAYEREGRSK